MKNRKLIIVIFPIISICILIICDYLNVITKLGLSVSLWSGFITGIFPIVLTIYLWKIEQKERTEQINEESTLQKKLILRSTYIEYFERLLEQINEYLIFLDCYILRKSLSGKKLNLDKCAENIVEYVKIYLEYQPWKISYRVYAFKGIDVDIFNYDYNGKMINLRAYMPYVNMSNQLSSIFNGQKFIIGLSGVRYIDIDENEQKEIAKSICKNREEVQELYDLLIYLKNDIEKRIAFD